MSAVIIYHKIGNLTFRVLQKFQQLYEKWQLFNSSDGFFFYLYFNVNMKF